MRRLEILFPERPKEGSLYIRLFTYTAFARAFAGILAGATVDDILEKYASIIGGKRQGGNIPMPSKIVAARTGNGVVTGGEIPTVITKRAAAFHGSIIGGLIHSFMARTAGAAISGRRTGSVISIPGMEKTGPAKSGISSGGDIRTKKEAKIAIGGGKVCGGTVKALWELSARSAESGIAAGGSVIGGAMTVRLRELRELDGLTLADMDNMELKDLDYITKEI